MTDGFIVCLFPWRANAHREQISDRTLKLGRCRRIPLHTFRSTRLPEENVPNPTRQRLHRHRVGTKGADVLAVGDVHRNFKAKTQIRKFRFRPFHNSLQ